MFSDYTIINKIKNSAEVINHVDKLLIIFLENFFDLRLLLGYTLFMSQTYQPNKRKRAKAHGFLVRSKTKTGRKVLQKRRRKGRAKLSV